MSGETTVVKAKYSEAADEVNKFPAEVSAPGAKSFDKYLEEKVLRIKKYAGAGALVSGELAIQEKTAETFTLPAATANFVVGCFSTVAEAKVTTSGGAFIEGDFITPASKTATIVLATAQHVILYANGANWMIVSGEPIRTNDYVLKAFTKAEALAEVEPSKTRPTLVIWIQLEAGEANLTIHGHNLNNVASTFVTFELQPGWKWTASVECKTWTMIK